MAGSYSPLGADFGRRPPKWRPAASLPGQNLLAESMAHTRNPMHEYAERLGTRFKAGSDHLIRMWEVAELQAGNLTERYQIKVGPERWFEAADLARKTNPMKVFTDAFAYAVDAQQRTVLFLDTLRRRGNTFVEHESAGCPPVLAFEYETLIDGRDLERPVNYALVRIIPPEGTELEPEARPFLIIDPRAGHGAGIGGFKQDSQVGMALRNGHPVYFVIFYAVPEPGQTILDVCNAEALFLRHVRDLHPNASRPVVIGNCQGGWAAMMLGAANPDHIGALCINGAPMSYWAGENGTNPMRYTGGLAGGSWPALLLADLGNGLFDGANLVMNFEMLNPANTFWTKYYDLYAKVDTEASRFLEFEKWWSGFFLLTDEEMRWIVHNLFIGNRLARGKVEIDGRTHFDLRGIESPIILFASSGDNITPPQQALNWIADVYRDAREIKARGQTIIYLLHEDIGHLGIFVSGRVAKKEYAEIVDVMQSISSLAPGLYEMKITDRASGDYDSGYHVVFEERSINDLLGHDDGREDEHAFQPVAKISEANAALYELLVGPTLRLFTNDVQAQTARMLHPLRAQRALISDKNPMLAGLPMLADMVQGIRQARSPDNLFVSWEKQMSAAIETSFNLYRDLRDVGREMAFHAVYGTLSAFGILVKPLPEIEDEDAVTEDLLRSDRTVRRALKRMSEGGFTDGVVRMMVLMADARGQVRRTRLHRASEVLKEWAPFRTLTSSERRTILHEQTIVVDFEPEQAIETLSHLFRSRAERERALEIIEYVAGDSASMHETSTNMLARLKTALGLHLHAVSQVA